MSPRARISGVDVAQLPWRGPGPGRPGLPLPPGRMPLKEGLRPRKRWRYIGVYAEDLMLCAARAQVGPFRQSFWALWDRAGTRRWAQTQMRPGSREVRMEAGRLRIEGKDVRADLQLGEASPVEAICPSGEGWGWTRKRAGIPVRGTVEAGGRLWQIDARGVDDQSAGYHQRHTSWHWSAGVGESIDGEPVAWNLVEGINDPPRRSERGVWIGGVPGEPEPVRFDGLTAVEFQDGSRLGFSAESERARDENLLIFRSRYRHQFGSFNGSLDGTELASGLGVMERHEAVW